MLGKLIRDLGPLALLALPVLLLMRSRTAKAGGGPATCKAWESTGEAAELQWREVLTGGAQPGDRLPMLVLLHGRGGDPDRILADLGTLRARARVIVPRGPVPMGKQAAWWELRSTTENQARLGSDMAARAEQLGRFLQAMVACKPTTRVVVAGHSQGAMAGLMLAAMEPQQVDFVVASAGWIPPAFWTSELPPVQLVHGAQDQIVPVERTRAMAEAWEDAGVQVGLNEVPGGHALEGELAEAFRSTVDAATVV